MRLLARPAHEIYALACREGAELSFAVGVEHLLLACAVLGRRLEEHGVSPDDIRERIRADERDALASLGISLDSVRGELEERFGEDIWRLPCEPPVTPEAKRILDLAARRRRRVTPDQMLVTLLVESATTRRLLFDLGVPVGTLLDRIRR